MRLLDGEHRRRIKRARQQAGPFAMQHSADDKYQQNHRHVRQRRQRPPDEMRALVGCPHRVAGETDDNIGHRFDDEQRQRPVNVQPIADVVGIVWRAVGVKVAALAAGIGIARQTALKVRLPLRRVGIGEGEPAAQGGYHAGQKSLVGVQVGVVVPVQPHEAEIAAEQHHQHEQCANDDVTARAGVLPWCFVQCSCLTSEHSLSLSSVSEQPHLNDTHLAHRILK